MAVEAPLSKYRKTNLKIYIAACIIFAAVFAYDGYFSKYQWSRRRHFYEKHVKDGRPDDTMIFNQVVPIVLVAAAVALAIRLWTVKDEKLLAGEGELVISAKQRISYDSIQKIDKTHFNSKGFFIITYRRDDGTESSCRLSNKKYDNMPAILDELVARIS